MADPVPPSRKRRKVKEYLDHMTVDEIHALASLMYFEYPKSLAYGLPSSLDELRDYIRDAAQSLSSETFLSLLNKSKDTVRDRVAAAPPKPYPVRANGGSGRSRIRV